MREWRAVVGQFVIIAALVICVPMMLRRIGISGTGGGLLAFALMAVIIIWSETARIRARRRKIEGAAGLLGFAPIDASELRLAIYPLRRAGSVQGAVRGSIRGLEAWLFDYRISNGEDSTSQTVAAFLADDANLPIFELRPLRLRSGAVSSDDDYFEYVRFDEMPSFGSRFTLKSSAMEGVRRYFKNGLLETLLSLEDCRCVVQGYFTTVVCYNPGVTVPPEELEAFATRCSNIAYALFSAGMPKGVSAGTS